MRSCGEKLNGPLVGSQVHHAFHSEHTGGAHFLLCDGSVRFVSENIDHTATPLGAGAINLNGPFGTYQRLAAINDGQPVSEFPISICCVCRRDRERTRGPNARGFLLLANACRKSPVDHISRK